MDKSQIGFPLDDWAVLTPEDRLYFAASIRAMRHMIAFQERVMKTAVWLLVILSIIYLVILVIVPLPQLISFLAGGLFVGAWITVFLLSVFRGGRKK